MAQCRKVKTITNIIKIVYNTNMKYIIGNWKLNPPSANTAIKIFNEMQQALPSRLGKVRAVIAPPYLFLPALKPLAQQIILGSQDAFYEQKGSFTGAISPAMLKKFGVKYVNLGHNERRFFAHESDLDIAKKTKAVLSQGMRPIICVGGGPVAQGISGRALRALIKRQLSAAIKLTSTEKKKVLIAFEPIGAIGSGRPATPKMISKTLSYIKKLLPNTPTLYGGSVNKKNATPLLQIQSLDGFLIGGASLKPKEFANIVKRASIGS